MMTDEEKKELGITPELEAKGSFNLEAPSYEPSFKPGHEPEPKPEPEPKKEEPPADGEKTDAKAEPDKPEPAKAIEPNKDKPQQSRLRDKMRKLGEMVKDAEELQKTLSEKFKKAEGKEEWQNFYSDQSEAAEKEILKAQEQMLAEYEQDMKEAAGENYDRLKQLAGKYSPEVGKDRLFSQWFLEHPRHYDTMFCLYEAFNSGKLDVNQFNGMILDDKKRMIENFAKSLDELRSGKAANTEPAAVTASAAEPPKAEEKPEVANGKPLPKLDGNADAQAVDPNDLDALFQKYRSRTLNRVRGK